MHNIPKGANPYNSMAADCKHKPNLTLDYDSPFNIHALLLVGKLMLADGRMLAEGLKPKHIMSTYVIYRYEHFADHLNTQDFGGESIDPCRFRVSFKLSSTSVRCPAAIYID